MKRKHCECVCVFFFIFYLSSSRFWVHYQFCSCRSIWRDPEIMYVIDNFVPVTILFI